jgi:hypothetical protein
LGEDALPHPVDTPPPAAFVRERRVFVIRACYKSNGVLYVVGVAGAPATCGVGDIPLAWGMQGPKGDVGPEGTFTG